MDMLQKRDMTLAVVILLMAAAAFDISHYTRHAPTAVAQMPLDGIVVKALDLSKDTEITVTSPNGGTNHLIVKDGEIWCSRASYPDKVYVHQGKKRLNGDITVCLPNQTIVTIADRE